MSQPAFRVPGALLPVAMSLAALAMVLGHFAVFGVTRAPDEGTAAHVFQLLILGQSPLVALFAVRWVPRLPSQALRVVAVQLSAAVVAIAAAHWLT